MIPTTVREKYRNCMATPTTSAFAIHSNGQVMVLDDASNAVVREQLASNPDLKSGMADASGSPKFMSVTVNGSTTGNQLTVVSIQPRQK
jgi:hypothetical protein